MIDYLYYRFYRLWLHSSLAEGAVFMGMLMFSVLLSTNVLTVWGMLTRYGIVAYPSDIQYYIIEGDYRGRHYCLVELAVLFQETLRQDYSQV